MFGVIGSIIDETGEEFTVRAGGVGIYLQAGLRDRYDFAVPLRMENVTNMMGHAADRAAGRSGT